MDAEIKAAIRSRIDLALGFDEPVRRGSRFFAGVRRIAVWGAAACLAVAAVSGWYRYSEVMELKQDTVTIFTEKSQKTNIILPDGTRVWLNSGSSLSYDGTFGLDSRDVRLEGEGYFDVAKNPECRFRVHTTGYTVEALGTSFNVKAYPDDAVSITTLIEGSVLIEAADGSSTVLEPLEAVVLRNGNLSKRISETAEFAGLWRNNELIVDSGTTLESLASLLEREYNIRFVFRNERIRNLEFEGIIKNNNLNNVLQLIELSGKVSYSIEDDTVVLDLKK